MVDMPLSLIEAAEALRAGATSSVALTVDALARADADDPVVGVYNSRFDESALAAAAAADAELAAGIDRGPLQGIPIGVKDLLATRDGPTTAQSLVLEPAWGEGKDAVCVARLRAAGAVITGKTSTMEFGCGMPDGGRSFPIPRNPWDTATWPGGSSSGTAVGVAAGLFLAGLGTDTAGSVRIPAAFCGVSGLKPTYGRVPRAGCVPLGFTLDHVGPIARSARDCAAVLTVIAGADLMDPTAVVAPAEDYVAYMDGSLAGMRIGVATNLAIPAAADPSLGSRIDAAIEVLSRCGADIVTVALPLYDEVMVATMLSIAAEALTYHRPDVTDRWTELSADLRALLTRGALLTAADYVQAQRVRTAAQTALRETFLSIDAVVTPVSCVAAPTYTEMAESESMGRLLECLYTAYWDGVGNPVLAVPVGFTVAGLPLSMQIAGRPFAEADVLRIGDAYQQATDWHRRLPPTVLAQ